MIYRSGFNFLIGCLPLALKLKARVRMWTWFNTALTKLRHIRSNMSCSWVQQRVYIYIEVQTHFLFPNTTYVPDPFPKHVSDSSWLLAYPFCLDLHNGNECQGDFCVSQVLFPVPLKSCFPHTWCNLTLDIVCMRGYLHLICDIAKLEKIITMTIRWDFSAMQSDGIISN